MRTLQKLHMIDTVIATALLGIATLRLPLIEGRRRAGQDTFGAMNSLKQELDFLEDPRGGAEDDSPSPLPLPRAILGKNNGRDEDDDRDHSDDDLVLGAPLLFHHLFR